MCTSYHLSLALSNQNIPPHAIKQSCVDCAGAWLLLHSNHYVISSKHVRRKMAEDESLVEGASEKLRLKIRTTRRSEEVEVAPDCTVKEVGVI